MVLGVLTGWLERREREAIAYLIEENRGPSVSVGQATAAAHGYRPASIGCSRAPGGPCHSARNRHDCHARHAAPLASAVNCSEMDLRLQAGAARRHVGDSTA